MTAPAALPEAAVYVGWVRLERSTTAVRAQGWTVDRWKRAVIDAATWEQVALAAVELAEERRQTICRIGAENETLRYRHAALVAAVRTVAATPEWQTVQTASAPTQQTLDLGE